MIRDLFTHPIRNPRSAIRNLLILGCWALGVGCWTLPQTASAGEVYDALRHLYPNAEFFKDYEVRDEIIVKWDTAKLGPQPTPAQITQAAADAAAAREAARIARQQELTVLEEARAKLASNQQLTQNELNAVLRALIRRSTTTSAGAAAPQAAPQR